MHITIRSRRFKKRKVKEMKNGCELCNMITYIKNLLFFILRHDCIYINGLISFNRSKKENEVTKLTLTNKNKKKYHVRKALQVHWLTYECSVKRKEEFFSFSSDTLIWYIVPPLECNFTLGFVQLWEYVWRNLLWKL